MRLEPRFFRGGTKIVDGAVLVLPCGILDTEFGAKSVVVAWV